MMWCDIVAVADGSVVTSVASSSHSVGYCTADCVVLRQDSGCRSYHAFDDYEYPFDFYLIMIRKTFQNFRNYWLNMMPRS